MFPLLPSPEDPFDLVNSDVAGASVHLYNVDNNATAFVLKRTLLGNVLVPLDELPKLNDTPQIESPGYLKSSIPPMDPNILNQAWHFFVQVFQTDHTEAALLITIDEDKQYHLHAPSQTNSYGSVNWKDDIDLPQNEVIVGSIHSHCDFSAFHSGIDSGDAAKNDGLHITMGHVDRANGPETDTMIVFSGVTWSKWDLSSILAGDWDTKLVDYPPEWHDKITKRKYSQPTKYSKNLGSTAIPALQRYTPSNDWDTDWGGEDMDDWEVEYYAYLTKQAQERSDDGYELSTHLSNTERVNEESRYYSNNPHIAREQVETDIKDLLAVADALGMGVDLIVKNPDKEQKQMHLETA